MPGKMSLVEAEAGEAGPPERPHVAGRDRLDAGAEQAVRVALDTSSIASSLHARRSP